MQPFNLKKAKERYPVCTRDGKDVKIYDFEYRDSTNKKHVITGKIMSKDYDCLATWTNDGRFPVYNAEHPNDLFLKSNNLYIYTYLDQSNQIHTSHLESNDNLSMKWFEERVCRLKKSISLQIIEDYE